MVTMLTKRIIPCLDVKNGRVVKGKQFVRLDDVGDPVALASQYNKEGADELVLLDITASTEKRRTMIDIVRKVAQVIFIPFTVGGGISTIEDMRELLSAGADKISINTAAVKNPSLIKEASEKFGSQCIVVAIDAKKEGKSWKVYINGGRERTDIDAVAWARRVEKLGAGEILLTSMDCDGTKKGYDIALTKEISKGRIPVIASGGAGSLETIAQVFTEGKADAALAASIFHYKQYSVRKVKQYLRKNDVVVRI